MWLLRFFPFLLYNPPQNTHNSRIIREFSLITIEGFYLWIFSVVSELARGLAAALGTICTFSQPCPRYYYCYWEGGGIWHWRAEDCGAVMAEMARRAHFTPPSEWLQISCTAVLIGNTLETSFHDHTYGSQKKEKRKKKAVRRRSKIWLSALS